MPSRPILRGLSIAQHSRLDMLAIERPDAKVIGWAKGGPVIRYGTTGMLRLITPQGRNIGTSYAALRGAD